MTNPICWWLGHRDDEWLENGGYYYAPTTDCTRCGKSLEYEDLALPSRYMRTKEWLRHWLFRRWVPDRCIDCKKRYGKHENCLQF